jgi:hypothetical protein
LNFFPSLVPGLQKEAGDGEKGVSESPRRIPCRKPAGKIITLFTKGTAAGPCLFSLRENSMIYRRYRFVIELKG